jgi:hypothetical protein
MDFMVSVRVRISMAGTKKRQEHLSTDEGCGIGVPRARCLFKTCESVEIAGDGIGRRTAQRAGWQAGGSKWHTGSPHAERWPSPV